MNTNNYQLPSDLQAEVDRLMGRRQALFESGETDSDEFGDCSLKAEKIKRDWVDACDKQRAAARNSRSSAGQVADTSQQSSASATVRAGAQSSATSSQPKTKLAEYLALKEREDKGDAPAGSAFAFWRENKTEISSDRAAERWSEAGVSVTRVSAGQSVILKFFK